MKLTEFVSADDATNYDPNNDEIGQAHRDDTRKNDGERLTLKVLNHLKKMRALKKLENLKRQDILSVMYAQDAGGGGAPGGMGF